MSVETLNPTDSDFSARTQSEELLRTLDSRRDAPEKESTGAKREMLVTPEAYDKLEGWGLSREQIDGLVELGSRYEYANVVAKAERIAQAGALIETTTTPKWQETLLLPNFKDYGERAEGQCGEIAIKTIRDMHATGWLENTNRDLTKKGFPNIVPVYCIGTSRTHFNNYKGGHMWSGLTRVGDAPGETITVDSSFLEISEQKTNGYDLQEECVNPAGFSALTTTNELPAGSFSYDAANSRWRWAGTASVLGVSANGELSVSLGFANSPTTYDMQPVLVLNHRDGTPMYVINGENDRPEWQTGGRVVSEETKDEVEAAFNALKDIKITNAEDADPDYIRSLKERSVVTVIAA